MKPTLLAASILISVSAASTPLSAGATVLYDALTNQTSGADLIFADGPLYASFSTGTSPVSLTDVMAKLTAAPGAASGSISVGLYSDAGTRPGSLLAPIGTLADSSIPPSPTYTNFDFPLSPAFQLKANTRYWIGFTTANQSVADLAWSNQNTGPGVATEFNFFKGAIYSNSQGPYQLRITGTAVGPPTSVTLVSGGTQSGVVGTLLAAPVVVGVVDANKNPVPGVSVTFTAANATANPTSAQTDSSAHASTQVTLGNIPGPASVTAGVTGLPPLTVPETANPSPTLPTISSVENAASSNAPGLPNGGIAQGAIFTIYGFNLGPPTPVLASSAFQSTTLNGTSAGVTVNGQTVSVLLYYTSAKQVSGLLPSNTPVGTGTITVTYNGNVGLPVPITVVQNNLGIFTITQDGAGVGIVTYPDYSLVSDLPAANCGGPNTVCGAANPGDVLILWGTGLGPVSAPDSSGPQPGNMPNVPLTLTLGGVQAQVTYQGRSGCCIGEDEIVFTVPPSTPTGCAVPLLVQIGNQISNNVVIPVAHGSRTCTPTEPTLAGNVFQQLTTSSAALGVSGLSLQRIPAACSSPPCQPSSVDKARGRLGAITIPAVFQPFVVSYLDVQPNGTCLVTNKANPVVPFTFTRGLEAGALTLTGPNGSATLTETPGAPTTYAANLGPGNFLSPGTYTFSAAGGKDVPAFTAPITIPAMPNWTNQSSDSIDRTNPLTITWSAVAQDTFVEIDGSSYTDSSGTTGASFTCRADPTALTFNVPANVLQQLPAGSFGNLVFVPGTISTSFAASGIVYPHAQSFFETQNYSTYK